jgi:uncharacterized ferredoxin-like protein
MDRRTAERMMAQALSIGDKIQGLDNIVSAIPDELEGREWAHRLGDVMRILNDNFIRPIARDFPDLDPDKTE